MTYLANETAHEPPVELYEFTRDLDVYRYTPNDVALTDADGATYSPAVIARRDLEASEEDTAHAIEVEVLASNPVVAWFQSLSQPHAVWLEVRRRHRGFTGAANEVLAFYGRVESATVRDDGRAVLTCVPIRKAIRRILPTVTVQRTCNWMLYDSATCTVAEADHKFAVTVTANSSLTLTVTGDPDPSELAGGFVEWYPDGDTGEALRRQWIVAHPSAGTVHLFAPEPTIPTATPSVVWVYRGCDRSVTTCHGTFGNVANFGGFPDMPSDNPFDVRLSD